jgi:hypothetical protein
MILQREAILEATRSDPESNYKLTGVVVHNGSPERGHYIALVESKEKEWYDCDDEWIKYFNTEQISYWSFGGESRTDQYGNCYTAYLLFYKKTDLEESEPVIPSDLEETLDMQNSTAWPATVFYSTKFIEYTLDILKQYPTDINVIELAAATVFKVGVVQEKSLYFWCQTLADTCLISPSNCLALLRALHKNIGNQLSLLIAITDTTAAELGHVMNQAVSNISDTTEGIVLALKTLGMVPSKRCLMLGYELISNSLSVLNVDWSDEDDALLLMVQHLVSDNQKESLKPTGRSVFQAVNIISSILADIAERRGVTDAMLELFDVQVITRMINVFSRSENFIRLITICISHVPSIYTSIQEKLSKLTTNRDAQSLLSSISASGALISIDIPDISLDFLWCLIPDLLFDKNKKVRQQIAISCIKLLRIPDQKMLEFYSNALLHPDIVSAPFAECSSSVLFFIGLIPKIKKFVINRKTSLAAEAIEVVFAAATMSPSSAAFFADSIYDIIRAIPDKYLFNTFILIIHHIVSIDREFANKIPVDIISIILSIDQITTTSPKYALGNFEDKGEFAGNGAIFNACKDMNEIMHFILVFKEKASQSNLSGLCATKLLESPCNAFCVRFKDMIKEGGFLPGLFNVPLDAPGIGNIELALVLWNSFEEGVGTKNKRNLRQALEFYMLSALEYAKPIALYEKTQTIQEVFKILAPIYPEDLKAATGKVIQPVL